MGKRATKPEPKPLRFRPLGGRVVVLSSDAPEQTASGLIIPDVAREKPQQGEVLAVGPGVRSDQTGEVIPVDIAVGDVIVYSKFGGTVVTVEHVDYLVIDARDVLAVVE